MAGAAHVAPCRPTVHAGWVCCVVAGPNGVLPRIYTTTVSACMMVTCQASLVKRCLGSELSRCLQFAGRVTMANVTTYVQKSDEDATGLSSVIKALGNTKTMSSGWTAWALKAFSVSFGTSVVAGLTCQMAFALPIGPVLPFLFGSTMGFVGGMCHRWHVDKREALFAVDEFPEIMSHHIYMLGPAQYSGINIQEWKKDLHWNLYKQQLAIVALYGASDVLSRVRQEREEQLFRQYTAQYNE